MDWFYSIHFFDYQQSMSYLWNLWPRNATATEHQRSGGFFFALAKWSGQQPIFVLAG